MNYRSDEYTIAKIVRFVKIMYHVELEITYLFYNCKVFLCKNSYLLYTDYRHSPTINSESGIKIAIFENFNIFPRKIYFKNIMF